MKNKKFLKSITSALIIAMLITPVGYAENGKTIDDSVLVTKETITKISPDGKEKDALYTIDGYRLSSVEELTDDIEVIKAHLYQPSADTNSTKSLYASLDLSSKFPAPEQKGQGTQGSCTAWAVAYAASSREEKMKWKWSSYSRNHCLSPAFLFNSLVRDGADTNISTAMNYMVNNGACSLVIMDYSEGSTVAPDSRQKKVASYFKAGSWNTITGTNAVKEVLSEGHGVVFAFRVPKGYSSENYVIYGNETIGKGAHAVCIVGYDDSRYGGAFKYLNSYGSGWGENGYGWITYTAFDKTGVNNYGGGIGYVINQGSNKDLKNNMGDVDFNGSVTAADARSILRYSSRLETYTDEQFVRSDVDGDGVISSNDSQFVLRYSSGLETEFPYFT